MAVEIVVGELGLDLVKSDLAAVVSNDVAETQENLGRIFTEAETVDAILSFGENEAPNGCAGRPRPRDQ